MSRVPTLIDTLLRLKNIKQSEFSDLTGIHRANLSKYLSNTSDLKGETLINLLSKLDIHLEEILENEIDKRINKQNKKHTLGEALETILKECDPYFAKTTLEGLSKKIKTAKDTSLTSAFQVVSEYKNAIKLFRSERL